MRFLKGAAVSLLGLLLFFSLSLFTLAYMVNQTILDRNFVITGLNRLDISGLLKDTITQQLSQQLRSHPIAQQIPQIEQRMAPVLNATITDLDPWIKEQISDSVNASYDYFLGPGNTINLKISLDTVKETLKKHLGPAIVQAPELAAVPLAQREQMADMLAQAITGQIPATVDVGQSLPRDVHNTLADIKGYIGYVRTAYWGLLGLMVLLVAGIILINSDLKLSARNLGTTFLTFGLFEYIGIFVTNYFVGAQSESFGLPPALQQWLPQFMKDLLAPLEQFSIVLVIIGLVLIITSFFIRSKPAEAKPPLGL